MKYRFYAFVLCAFVFLSGRVPEVRAEFVPVFYESSIVLPGGPIMPLSANSAGDYFVVNPQRKELIILNNSLNEVTRVALPWENDAWYNEVAVAPDDTVWVSTGYYSKQKVFQHYDGNGNLLNTLYYANWRMVHVSNWGIQLDRNGYLYFISAEYSESGVKETWLNKLDPLDGSLVERWRVPVDGGYQWYRGIGITSGGEVLWGNFESRTIYKFSPQTGQTVAFAFLPPSSQSNTMSLSVGPGDEFYVVEQPSAFWRYYPSYLHLFDSAGNYRGSREIDFRAAGVGLATFEDEVVLSSYYTGILIKYTSICKNSTEYPYCVYTLKGVEDLTQHYLTLGSIKEPDGQKILLELKKVGEDLQKNMVDSAKNTLTMLIHYVGVKNGRTIDRDIASIYLTVLEQTRNNL